MSQENALSTGHKACFGSMQSRPGLHHAPAIYGDTHEAELLTSAHERPACMELVKAEVDRKQCSPRELERH